MSDLHTKLEEEVSLLKTKMINAENDIKALRNKLDVWRNEANNMIKKVKQNYTSLDRDFMRLASYLKEFFVPLPDDLMKRINNMKSVPVPMDKAARKDFLAEIKKINREFNKKDELNNLGGILNQPPPSPICGECGTKMIMDIATLNKIDWYCPKCCSENPTSPLYKKPSTKISMEELAEKAIKIRKIYPDFQTYIAKFLEVSEKVITDNNFSEWDLYNIMKEAVELYNPDYEVPEEGFLDILSNNTITFMNECFDYIISNYELGVKIRTELEEEPKKCSENCSEEEMINTCPECGGIYCHDCEKEVALRETNEITIHFCPICKVNLGR